MPAPVTPAGLLSKPVNALRQLVANSSAFRDWVDAADVNAALLRVHIISTPRNPTSPFALIDFGDFIRDREAVKGGIAFKQRSGSALVLYFRANVDEGTNEPDAALAFCNAIGAVWDDLERAAGVHANRSLPIISMEMLAPPARIVNEKRQQAGDYYECAISLSYSRQP